MYFGVENFCGIIWLVGDSFITPADNSPFNPLYRPFVMIWAVFYLWYYLDMKRQKDAHTHSYKSMRLINVMADNPAYTGNPKAILVRKCACSHEEAFEYADRNILVDRVKEMVEKRKLESIAG